MNEPYQFHSNTRAEWGAFLESAFNLKMEIAEGEFAAVIGSTRYTAARVASPY
jgi:hypothetical protein